MHISGVAIHQSEDPDTIFWPCWTDNSDDERANTSLIRRLMLPIIWKIRGPYLSMWMQGRRSDRTPNSLTVPSISTGLGQLRIAALNVYYYLQQIVTSAPYVYIEIWLTRTACESCELNTAPVTKTSRESKLEGVNLWVTHTPFINRPGRGASRSKLEAVPDSSPSNQAAILYTICLKQLILADRSSQGPFDIIYSQAGRSMRIYPCMSWCLLQATCWFISQQGNIPPGCKIDMRGVCSTYNGPYNGCQQDGQTAVTPTRPLGGGGASLATQP